MKENNTLKNGLLYAHIVTVMVIIAIMIFYSPYFVLIYTGLYYLILCYINKRIVNILKAIPYMGGVLRLAALGTLKDVEDYRNGNTKELDFLLPWPEIGQTVYLDFSIAVASLYVAYTYLFFVKGDITAGMKIADVKALNSY